MEDLLNNQLWLTIFETCDKEYLKYKIYNETSFKESPTLDFKIVPKIDIRFLSGNICISLRGNALV